MNDYMGAYIAYTFYFINVVDLHASSEHEAVTSVNKKKRKERKKKSETRGMSENE